MEIPAWCEEREKHRLIIDTTQYGSPIFSTWELENLVNQLNELFQEHQKWSNLKAKPDIIKTLYCKMCNVEYVPLSNNKGEEVCSCCRRGKTDFAIQVLDEKGGHDENILSRL